MGGTFLALSCGLVAASIPLQSALALQFGSAFDAERPAVAAVAANPKAYVDRTIGFRGAACVDRPKADFLCIVTGGGRAVQIEASGLGASGGDIVAERLIGPCKGLDKINNPVCRFDVECKPISALTEAVMLEFEGVKAARLICGVIEMRAAGRR